MAIENIQNGNFNWATALGQVFAEKGLSEDSGLSTVLDGQNVTISFVNPTSGETVSRTMTLPDLGSDNAEEAVENFLLDFAEQVEQLADMLKGLAAESGEEPTAAADAGTGSASGAKNKIFFSIYELMDLMQRVAQAQRDSAREVRQSRLAAEAASITAQAAHERNAALYGLIVNAITATVQLGMLAASTVSAVKSVQAAGHTAAAQDLAQSQQDLKTLEAAKNGPKAAGDNLDKVLGNCGDRDAVSTAADGYLDRDSVKNAKTQLEGAENALAEAKQAWKADHQGAEMPTDEEFVKNGPENMGKLVKAVETAKATYASALDDVMAEVDTAFAGKVSETKSAEAKYIDDFSAKHPINNHTNHSAASAGQKDLMGLGETRSVLKAKIALAKAEAGLTGSIDGDLKAAELGVDAKTEALKTDKGYRLAMNNPGAGAALQQLSQMIGTIGEGVAKFVEANERAKGTLEQANQKQAEQGLEEANGLFQQAMDMINNIRNLILAVMQDESQLNQQIIKA